MKFILVSVFIALIFLITACAPNSANDPGAPLQEPTQTPAANSPVAPVGTVDLGKLTPSPFPDETPQEMPKPGGADPSRYLLSEVSQDMAARLNIDVSEIEMLEMEQVDWPDSSLGCPQAGVVYQTVITPGYRFILAAGQNQSTYHTDQTSRFVYCVDGQPVP